MTDAPERIWFVHVGKNIVPNSKRTGPKDVEYIRADLTPSPEVVKELVEALAACEAWIADGGHVDDDDARHGETGARRVYEQARAALAKLEAWE